MYYVQIVQFNELLFCLIGLCEFPKNSEATGSHGIINNTSFIIYIV